jgi:hypothetical protein
MKAAPLVTRYEVQRQRRSGAWGTLFGEGPVRFDTKREAAAEIRRLGKWDPLRIVLVDGVLRISELDLEEHVFPLVARFWRLWAPGRARDGALQPYLDVKRFEVGTNWAILSGWHPAPIGFAPEVEVPRLWKRFPFARPRTVEAVLRLLTLHELAHYARGHNGLSVSLDHRGTREELRSKFAVMEKEADELLLVFWMKGLTAETVKPRVVAAKGRAAKAA